MKLAIFGATGRTGRHLVEGALAQGHEVTAFARTPANVPQSDRVRAVQGDIRDAAKVEEAIQGQDAVLVALAPTKPAFDTMAVTARHIVPAMQKHGVRRLITLTGAGVPDPEHDRPKLLNHIITFLLKRISGKVLEDAQRHVDQVRASDLDWTIVRVPVMADGPRTGSIRVGWVGVDTGARVNRPDVADFMLQQLSATTHVRQAPVISN